MPSSEEMLIQHALNESSLFQPGEEDGVGKEPLLLVELTGRAPQEVTELHFRVTDFSDFTKTAIKWLH